jgi:DNA-binding beta-propeller fold protein YncE
MFGAGGAAVSPDGRFVYVAAAASDSVAAFATPDDVAPSVVIGPASVKVAAGKVPLTVTCPASEVSCEGQLTLLLGKRTVGSARFLAASGQTARVQIMLSAAARKELASKKRLSAIVRAAARDLHGNAKQVQRAVTLRA